jgi:hypothetical protein
MQVGPARKAAVKRYSGFVEYIKRHGITHIKLAKQLKAYLGELTLKYKMTSVKTAFGHIIGEWQRGHDVKVEGIEVKELSKWLECQTRLGEKCKAKPITSTELPEVAKKIGASKLEQTIMETLVRTCCRAGNLSSLIHIGLQGMKWTILFKTHKTRSHNIHGNVVLNTNHFSDRLRSYIENLKEGSFMFKAKDIQGVIKKLQKAGVKLHSFRRGGILELYADGVPFERIRALTKHTSDGAMLEYLDVLQVQ